MLPKLQTMFPQMVTSRTSRTYHSKPFFIFNVFLQIHSHSLADLIELRALRRTRQGIDATKLVVGDARRKRRRAEEAEEEGEAEKGGLRAGAPEVRIDDEDDSE